MIQKTEYETAWQNLQWTNKKLKINEWASISIKFEKDSLAPDVIINQPDSPTEHKAKNEVDLIEIISLLDDCIKRFFKGDFNDMFQNPYWTSDDILKQTQSAPRPISKKREYLRWLTLK